MTIGSITADCDYADKKNINQLCPHLRIAVHRNALREELHGKPINAGMTTRKN